MKIVFDSDRLVPCNDKSHQRSYFIDGIPDDRGVLGLVVNCQECGRIFDSSEDYDRAEAAWFINAS